VLTVPIKKDEQYSVVNSDVVFVDITTTTMKVWTRELEYEQLKPIWNKQLQIFAAYFRFFPVLQFNFEW